MGSFGQNLTQFLMSDEMAELTKKISDDILKNQEENKQSCIKYQRHLLNNKDAELTMHNEWLKKDVWSLHNEALPLAIGIHPNCWETVKYFKGEEFRALQVQAHKIKELIPSCVGYSLTIQNIDDKERHWKVKPSDFINWLQEKDLTFTNTLHTNTLPQDDAKNLSHKTIKEQSIDENKTLDKKPTSKDIRDAKMLEFCKILNEKAKPHGWDTSSIPASKTDFYNVFYDFYGDEVKKTKLSSFKKYAFPKGVKFKAGIKTSRNNRIKQLFTKK